MELVMSSQGPHLRIVFIYSNKIQYQKQEITLGVVTIYIYPDNLRAKPKLWLWELKDIVVIGVGALLSVLALAQGLGMFLLVLTVLYAFLSIRMEGASILDFLRCAVCFLFLHQQYYEWEERKP